MFPAIPLLLGLMLMIRTEWLRGVRLHAPILNVAIPTLLIILPVALLSFVDLKLLAAQAFYLSVTCSIVLAVALNRTAAFRDLPLAVTTIGTISCLLAIVTLVSQGPAGVLQGGNRLVVEGNANPIATALNGAITSFAALIVGLASGRNRTSLGLIAGVAFGLGAGTVLLSLTRSSLIFLVSMTGFYLIYLQFAVDVVQPRANRMARGKVAFVSVLLGFTVAAPLALRAALGPMFDRIVVSAFYRLQSVLGIVGADNVAVDGSSDVHAYLVRYNWEHWTLFGHGIMAQARAEGAGTYAHFSYLQALYDFGLAGGLLFFLVMAVVPIVLLIMRLRKGKLSATDALVVLLYAFLQGEHLLHGTPYEWQIVLSVSLMYVLFGRPLAAPARPAGALQEAVA